MLPCEYVAAHREFWIERIRHRANPRKGSLADGPLRVESGQSACIRIAPYPFHREHVALDTIGEDLSHGQLATELHS